MNITDKTRYMNDIERHLFDRVASLERRLSNAEREISFYRQDADAKTVSQREAARIIGVSPRTISLWRVAGYINPIDGTTRYSLGEIRRVTKLRNHNVDDYKNNEQ